MVLVFFPIALGGIRKELGKRPENVFVDTELRRVFHSNRECYYVNSRPGSKLAWPFKHDCETAHSGASMDSFSRNLIIALNRRDEDIASSMC